MEFASVHSEVEVLRSDLAELRSIMTSIRGVFAGRTSTTRLVLAWTPEPYPPGPPVRAGPRLRVWGRSGEDRGRSPVSRNGITWASGPGRDRRFRPASRPRPTLVSTSPDSIR
jgi:hypothetical protein